MLGQVELAPRSGPPVGPGRGRLGSNHTYRPNEARKATRPAPPARRGHGTARRGDRPSPPTPPPPAPNPAGPPRPGAVGTPGCFGAPPGGPPEPHRPER